MALRPPLYDIDVNVEVANLEPEDEETYLLDLNIGGEEHFLLDLNTIPNSLTSHVEQGTFGLPESGVYMGEDMFDLNHNQHEDGACMEEQTNIISDLGATLGVGLVVHELDIHPNSGIDVDLEVDLEVPGEENIVEEQPQNQRNKMFTNVERTTIYQALLEKSVNGKLKRGVTNMVALLFSISKRTVQRIWKRGKESEMHDVSHRKTKNCRRKRIQIDPTQIRQIPLSRRTTIRSLAYALNTNSTAVFRLLKSGAIRRHSNVVGPLLKEENKKSRLEFCLSMLEGSLSDPVFKSMNNIVHIDEKWFYMTKKAEKYYLLSDEDEPHRTCKGKNFIAKVMFLTALTRSRFDSLGNETSSGKIGSYPFVTQEPAKRTSVNRVAGTMETKAMTSIKRDDIRSFLIEKVLPDIREKWPREDRGSTIFIQQDNARTHIHLDDPEFIQAATQNRFDIRLICQPANSPDLNVLDLGFFSAIQSLQHKEAPKTIDELVNAVVKSFEYFSSTKSNRIFLTLQLCMIEIMKTNGSNKYKIPHVNKEKLERELGQLPIQLKCDPTLVQNVLNYLNTSSA